MARISGFKRLPPEVRELIGSLREKGRTIDDILDALKSIDVSVPRSTLGEWTKNIDAVAKKMEQSRVMADAIVRQFGDTVDSKTTRLNIQMLHTVLFQACEKGLSGESEGFDPKDIMNLAKSLDHMTRASKTDIEFIAKVKEEAHKDACKRAAETAVTAGREQGLDERQVNFIRSKILGIEESK